MGFTIFHQFKDVYFFSNFNISEIRLLLKVKSYDRVSMAVVWLRFVIPKVLKVFVSPPSSMDIT